MNSRILSCTVSAVILSAVITGGLCMPDFFDKYQKHLLVCYNDSAIFSKNYHYPAQSLENLLAIIEKIERHYAFGSYSFNEIIIYLMARFRFDGIFKSPITVSRPSVEWTKDPFKPVIQDLQLRMISNGPIQDKYKFAPVDFFTLEERCALHWMLSHSLNLTRRGDENNHILTPPPFLVNNRLKRQVRDDTELLNTYSRYPLEWGVIHTPYGTVATSLVLLGLATVTNKQNFEVFFRAILPNLQDEEFARLIIDMRFVPFSPLAMAAERSIRVPGDIFGNQVSQVGPDGWWNCSVCPNEFTLRFKPTLATDAQVYGSLDGFFLAMKLADATPSYLQLKLSHILRMYYNRGIFGELRACNRFKWFKQYTEQNLQILNDNIAKVIVLHTKGNVGSTSNLATSSDHAQKITSLLLQNYTEGPTPSKYQCTDVTDVTIEPETIPQVDLYIILDSAIINDQIRYSEIAILIGEIGNLLDISTNGSHIGVYVNDDQLFNILFPMNRTYPSAELKCRLKWLNFENLYAYPRPKMPETIKLLNQHFVERGTYEELNQVKKTPSKVVLFVLSGQVNDLGDVRLMMDLFRRNHPEVETLVTGSSTGGVEVFVPNVREDFFNYGNLLEARDVAQRIYQRLQRMGSLLYYPYCHKWYSERIQSIMITSYIANNTRQFFTVPSKTFNASTDLKIDVRSIYYSLRVCVSRGPDIFVLTNKVQCEIVAAGTASKTIFYNNPCNGLSRFCPPIHLRVETIQQATGQKGGVACIGEYQLCRTADEGPFMITIAESYCGCADRTVSLLLITLSFLIVFLYNHFA